MMKKSIAEVKEILAQAAGEELENLLMQYAEDSRAGVQKLVLQKRKQQKSLEEEYQRLEMMTKYEQQYRKYAYICGVDEVGRGPLAGPVVAGAVILPKDCKILYLNDSKKLSPKKREALYYEIKEKAIAVGIGVIDAKRIDEINILQATYEAMKFAIANLSIAPNLLLNDAVTLPDLEIKQIPIIKGDEKSISIAAASVIAKVTRDKMMEVYHEEYPNYQFHQNKGYGSSEHLESLSVYGKCPLHRQSFLKNLEVADETKQS